MQTKFYRPLDAAIYSGRSDAKANERLFQTIECIDLNENTLAQAKTKNAIAFCGFACDSGIKRNLGRMGASQGPDAIRKVLANYCVHETMTETIVDVGNIICNDDDLETAQLALSQLVSQLIVKGYRPLVLGGGHEIAWGHFQGLQHTHPDLNIGIINFDAHFDLRPLLKNHKGTSGTPFLQIANHCAEHAKPFYYLCLGIEPKANSEQLFVTAKKLNANYVLAETIHDQPSKAILKIMQPFIDSVDAVYLTLCLDVFAEAVAPGVSAPQPFGLTPMEVKPLLKAILESGKVLSFDIAELSPPLDRDQQTARLAASFVYEYLTYVSSRA